MLHLILGAQEALDEETNEFVNVGGEEFSFEHSLLSISEWESKWKKNFIEKNNQKSDEEILDYLVMMCLERDRRERVRELLDSTAVEALTEYIGDSQSATKLPEKNKSGTTQRDVITSELIYYWMVAYTIPFDCESWNINRLLTLIEICNIKNQSPKKTNPRELAAQQRALNEQRRMEFNTSG